MLYDLVRRTRSYRRFNQEKEISEKDLREMVDLARLGSSAANRQPLKFLLSFTPEKNGRIFPHLRWAGYLSDWDGPEPGERPAGYVLILGDKEISDNVRWDQAIAAELIMLGASEKGLGGCIFASIDREKLRGELNLPKRYDILLAVALGVPAEKVVIDELEPGGNIEYYRDDRGVHHVPKRKLSDLVLDY